MDLDLWLDSVLPECALLESAQEVLRLVPDLASDAPVCQDLLLDDDSLALEWGFPVRFSHPLRAVLAPYLLKSLSEFLGDGQPEHPDMLTPEKLGREPLVGTLVGLLGEASLHGPRCVSGVLLELSRQSSALLWGDEAETKEAAGAGTLGLEAKSKELLALDPREQGRVLGQVAYSLCGRLSAAMQLAQRFHGDVAPTRFYQALLKNKMALVVPAQPFEPGVHLPLAAGMQGLEVDDGLLVGIHLAVTAAAKEGLEGKGGAQALFRGLAGGRESTANVALEEPIAIWALHGLSDLVGVRQLKKAGLKGAQARAILKGEGAGSAVALYAGVGETLRTWDLLASLAQRSTPIWRLGRDVFSTRGKLKESLKWELLVPRGEAAEVEASVVLVRLGPARAQVLARAENGQRAACMLALAGVWQELVLQAEELGGLAGTVGDDGVALFLREQEADAFARAAEGRLQPPIRIDLEPMDKPLALPGRAAFEVQTGRGGVLGGWSGERLAVWGDAVAALRGGAVAPAASSSGRDSEPGMQLLTEPTDEAPMPEEGMFVTPDHLADQGGLTGDPSMDPFADPALDTVDEFFLPPPQEILGDLAEMPPEDAHPMLERFRDYVTCPEGGGHVVFGLPKNGELVDRHTYLDTGEPLDAYTAFVMDKAREGYEPQKNLAGVIPEAGQPLDLDCLQRALDACEDQPAP
jgi:hypothetical protein